MSLLLELSNGQKWTRVGEVPPGQAGSIGDNSKGRREIVMFTCDEDHCEVWRSVGGIDLEQGVSREVFTLGRRDVVRLQKGDVHEMDIQTDQMSSPARLRFTVS